MTNRVVLLKVIKGVTAERVPPALLLCPAPYEPMFLDNNMLRECSKDPETGISEEFLDEALGKGDECYGIVDGDGKLVSYAWYARTPTRFDPPDLMLHFSNRLVYIYKGYTNVRHRGQRLLPIVTARALDHYLKLGYKGLISCIASNNFSSLKVAYRMGSFEFGTIHVVKIFGRYFTHASDGCRSRDFCIVPIVERIGSEKRMGSVLLRHERTKS